MKPILILLHSSCQQLHHAVKQLATSDTDVTVHSVPIEKTEVFNLPSAGGYVVISRSAEVCRTLREKVVVKNDTSFFIQLTAGNNERLFKHADLLIEPDTQSLSLAVRCALRQIRLRNKAFAFKAHSVTKEGGMRESSTPNAASQQKRFMMMVNHELRTPATIISTSLEMLKMNAGQMNDTGSRFLENAIDGSRRLNNLLQNLLLALPLQPAAKPARNTILLHPLLQKLQDDIQPVLLKRNIRLNVDCPGCPEVPGDVATVRRLFDELLSNALKYTPNGGEISLDARSINDTVRVTIQDNGIGIKKSRLGSVFQAFYQRSDAMKHHSSKTAFMGAGMGLGLAVCKNIVKAHGGEIKAGSPGEGRGTTISFTLPTIQDVDRRNTRRYRMAV